MKRQIYTATLTRELERAGRSLDCKWTFQIIFYPGEQWRPTMVGPPDPDEYEVGELLLTEITANRLSDAQEIEVTQADRDYAVAYFWAQLANNFSALKEAATAAASCLSRIGGPSTREQAIIAGTTEDPRGN
jgi:hypothetical protein